MGELGSRRGQGTDLLRIQRTTVPQVLDKHLTVEE